MSGKHCCPANSNPRFKVKSFSSLRDYVQDERYIARQHMDVRRDSVSFTHHLGYAGNHRPLVPDRSAHWSTGVGAGSCCRDRTRQAR